VTFVSCSKLVIQLQADEVSAAGKESLIATNKGNPVLSFTIKLILYTK